METPYPCNANPSMDICNQVESPSPLDNLKRRKIQLEEKLLDINQAIEALESNPEVERTLTLLNKAIRY